MRQCDTDAPTRGHCMREQDKFDEFISPDEGLFERNM